MIPEALHLGWWNVIYTKLRAAEAQTGEAGEQGESWECSVFFFLWMSQLHRRRASWESWAPSLRLWGPFFHRVPVGCRPTSSPHYASTSQLSSRQPGRFWKGHTIPASQVSQAGIQLWSRSYGMEPQSLPWENQKCIENSAADYFLTFLPWNIKSMEAFYVKGPIIFFPGC